MQSVLSNTLSLRRREIRREDARYYYELFPAPQSMSQGEEDELIARAQDGCSEAEEILTRQYAGIGIATALRLRWTRSYRGVDLDSLVSAALLGVVEGIRHFDTTRGSKITTCIWWWVMAYVRRERKAHEFVRNGPETYVSDFTLWDTDQETYALGQSTVEDALILDEEREEMKKLISEVLDEREAEIINRRFTACEEDMETLREIGADMNIARQRVGQIKDRAIEKLQRAVA